MGSPGREYKGRIFFREYGLMAESRRILVIVDPTSDAQPAVEKGVWLAERLGATVELFICDYEQHLAGAQFYDSESLRASRVALIDGHLRRLRELVRSFDAREGWAEHGCLSMAAWLNWRLGWLPVTARERMRVARALEAFRQMVDPPAASPGGRLPRRRRTES